MLGGVLRVLRVLVGSLTCLDGVASRNPEISSCRRDVGAPANSDLDVISQTEDVSARIWGYLP